MSGRTTRHFDDVLVGATKTLPRQITDWLAPWDLENLVPYTEDYLAGFSSEVYQVDLDEGFDIARQVMDETIRGDVRRAIGGDQQRVTGLRTRHGDTTFKHVLLPLWSAGFRFRDKSYRFVVNGRTGKVRGERPWSVVKITLAAIAGAVLLATALVLAQGAGVFSSAGGFGPAIERRVPFDRGYEAPPLALAGRAARQLRRRALHGAADRFPLTRHPARASRGGRRSRSASPPVCSGPP